MVGVWWNAIDVIVCAVQSVLHYRHCLWTSVGFRWSVEIGLVVEYFFKKKIPNIMGLFMYLRPLILWDFLMCYLLWDFNSYVQRLPNIMGLYYDIVQSSLFYYGAFLCTITL